MNYEESTIEYMPDEGVITFSEFPLAVTLLCLGYSLTSFYKDPKNPGRFEFLFNKTETKQAIEDYWAGKLKVEPKQYWNTSRELKSRIRQQ